MQVYQHLPPLPTLLWPEYWGIPRQGFDPLWRLRALEAMETWWPEVLTAQGCPHTSSLSLYEVEIGAPSSWWMPSTLPSPPGGCPHAQRDLTALPRFSLVLSSLLFVPQVVPVAARLLLEMFSGELSWSADSIRLQISNPDLKDRMVEQFKELHHIWQSQQQLQPVAQVPPAGPGPWPMHPVGMQ